MGTSVSQADPLGDASLPTAAVMGAFVASFAWQPLSGGVMIGGEIGSIASHVTD